MSLWRRLRRDRGTLLGAALLFLLALCALLAEPLSPYRPETQHRRWSFHPPMLNRLQLHDGEGWHLPFVHGIGARGADLRYGVDRSVRHPLRLWVHGEPYRLLGLWECDRHLFGVGPEGGLFLLGTDRFGRDVLSRLLHGARVSLGVSLLGVLVSLLLAVLVGGVAGYLGGLPDFWLMRAVELALAVPGLYLLLTLREAFGRELGPLTLLLVMVLSLALVDWAPHARIVRGMVLSLKERPHVLAARGLGFSGSHLLFRQILPGTRSYLLAGATLSLPSYVLGEAALSFLGLGVQEPHASWGLMLRDAQSVRLLQDFPWVLLPGLFLFLTVLGFNLLGEGLRDATDPHPGGPG